jgi:hypothetical protein
MVTLASIILALADCLDALDEGTEELEKRLKKHESYRQELTGILEIVKELRAVGQEEEAIPSGQFVRELKERLLTELRTASKEGGGEG